MDLLRIATRVASGLTKHLPGSPGKTMCGEAADPATVVESVKDSTCHYCSVKWQKDNGGIVGSKARQAGAYERVQEELERTKAKLDALDSNPAFQGDKMTSAREVERTGLRQHVKSLEGKLARWKTVPAPKTASEVTDCSCCGDWTVTDGKELCGKCEAAGCEMAPDPNVPGYSMSDCKRPASDSGPNPGNGAPRSPDSSMSPERKSEVQSNFRAWCGPASVDEWKDEVPHWAKYYAGTEEGDGLREEDIAAAVYELMSGKVAHDHGGVHHEVRTWGDWPADEVVEARVSSSDRTPRTAGYQDCLCCGEIIIDQDLCDECEGAGCEAGSEGVYGDCQRQDLEGEHDYEDPPGRLEHEERFDAERSYDSRGD